jgi:hypothetical protein
MANNNKNQSKSPFSGAASRFGSSNNNKSSGSRFGGSSGNSNNNQSFSPFGSSSNSRLPRFGRQAVNWTVLPMSNAAIHITLDGLGDPFHRLLGKPLNTAYGDPQQVIDALNSDQDLLADLTAVLDEAWESYDFTGAALLYPVEDNIRQAFTAVVQPTPPPPPKAESDDDDESDQESDDDAQDAEANNATADVQTLRVIDPAFVLNMLARARSNVVVANTPLALEAGFLQQSFLCDDPRIVAIARATGCIQEVWA